MRLVNNNQPKVFDRINSYSIDYNYNIEEVEDGYAYDSIRIECPIELLSSNIVFKSLIEGLYPLSVELKLKNDYESAVNGIEPIEKKQPYLDFLQARKDLHDMVENDCIINGIPL